MPSRISARRDLTAHASASSSQPSSTSSSASSTASAKVTEHGQALQVREGGHDVNQRSSRHSVKRTRVDSIPSSDGDEDDSSERAASHPARSDMTDVDDEVKDSSAAHRGAAAASAPPPPSSTSESAPAPSQPTMTAPASTRIETVAPHEEDYAPRWVRYDKLVGIGLDPRVPTALVVDLNSDSRFPSLPRVARDYYSLPSQLKRTMTADLLGDSKGFAMKAPAIPRCLLPLALPTTASLLSAQQLAWCEELTRQAQQSGGTVCDFTERWGPAGDVSAAACSALFDHIAPDVLRPLWPPEQLTQSWDELLAPTSVILKDHIDTEQSKLRDCRHPGHLYSLRLCGATPEVTYVIACAIVSYATLSEDKPDVLRGLLRLLDGKPLTVVADSSTDSDSSDGEAGFQQVGNRRQKARRDFKATCALKEALASTLAAPSLSDARGTADSTRPDLQLVTRVTMRSWRDRFLSCIIGNWESLGLPNTYHLKEDPLYSAVTTAIPELCNPARARWIPHEVAAGGTTVSLIVHEGLREVVATLNHRLRVHPLLGNASLTVTSSFLRHARGGRGRPVADSAVTLSLTPEIVPATRLPRSPQSSAQPGSQPSTISPSLPGSFADRVKQGLRRVAQNPIRNNRPRKEQKTAPASATLPSQSAAAPATPSSQAAQSSSSALQTPPHSRSVVSSSPPNQSQPPAQLPSASTGQSEAAPSWQVALTKRLDAFQSNLDRQRTQFEVAFAQWEAQRTQMMADFQSMLQTSIVTAVRALLTEMLPSLLPSAPQQALSGLVASSVASAASAAASAAATQPQHNAILPVQPMQQHNVMSQTLPMQQMSNLPSPSQTIGSMLTAYSPAMQNSYYYPNGPGGMFPAYPQFAQGYPFYPLATPPVTQYESPSAPAMGSAGAGGALSSFDTVDGAPVPPA